MRTCLAFVLTLGFSSVATAIEFDGLPCRFVMVGSETRTEAFTGNLTLQAERSHTSLQIRRGGAEFRPTVKTGRLQVRPDSAGLIAAEHSRPTFRRKNTRNNFQTVDQIEIDVPLRRVRINTFVKVGSQSEYETRTFCQLNAQQMQQLIADLPSNSANQHRSSDSNEDILRDHYGPNARRATPNPFNSIQ